MPVFEYDASAKRYRKPNGQFLSQKEAVSLRDRYVDGKKEAMSGLAGRLARGERTIQEFELQMRRELKTTYLAEYMLGRGGRNAMTQRDFGILGAQLKQQYQFLHSFMEDVKAGKLSERQIAARAALYFESASQAFERGRAAAFTGLVLPAYPGDGRAVNGNTQCLANCRCSWSIKETDEAYEATWTLGGSEACDGCQANRTTWKPFVQSKGQRILKVVAA